MARYGGPTGLTCCCSALLSLLILAGAGVGAVASRSLLSETSGKPLDAAGVDAMLEGIRPELERWPFAKAMAKLEEVLDPRLQASSCRLQDKLRRWALQDEPLVVALTGGSASALSCSQEAHTTILDLFGGFMRDAFPHAAPALETVNLAQGGTNSVWSTIMMDSLLPHSVDVLVWEYAINDALGGSTGQPKSSPEEMVALLELWLRTAARLPSRPAIVLLFLWDSPTDEGFPTASEWEATIKLVQAYADAGLEVSTVVVSAGLGRNTTSVLRDFHHPNCDGSVFIGRLLQARMLSALHAALADDSACGDKQYPPQPTSRSLVSQLLTESADDASAALLAASDIMAVHNWQPRFGREPAVFHSSSQVELMTGAKAAAGREDRKLEFKLPACDGPKPPLEFFVHEHGVTGVALGFSGGGHMKHGYSGMVQVRINDGPPLEVSQKVAVDPTVASHVALLSRLDPSNYFPLWHWPKGGVHSVSVCKVVSSTECNGLLAVPHAKHSPEYKQCIAEHGQDVGDWGHGDPQLNWLVLVREDQTSLGR